MKSYRIQFRKELTKSPYVEIPGFATGNPQPAEIITKRQNGKEEIWRLDVFNEKQTLKMAPKPPVFSIVFCGAIPIGGMNVHFVDLLRFRRIPLQTPLRHI